MVSLVVAIVVIMAVVAVWAISVGLELWGPATRRARDMAQVRSETDSAKRAVQDITRAAQSEMLRLLVEGRARRERE
jgi:hypothetical protein